MFALSAACLATGVIMATALRPVAMGSRGLELVTGGLIACGLALIGIGLPLYR